MTDKQLNKDVNGYIKEIKSLLICDLGTKRKFINDFKNDLFEYIDSNSVSDIEEVYKHFGTPQDISKAFFENADIKKIKKKMNISKTVLIGVVAALIIWAVGVTAAVIDAHETETYIVDEMYDGIQRGDVIDKIS